MKFEIDKIIKMGKSHSLHCEDDLFIEENDNFILCAVFDGCSSGIDSHYASTKHKYLLNDVNHYYKMLWKEDLSLTSIEDILRSYVYGIYVNLLNERYKVNEEMLSTIVLCFINKQTNEYGIIFCGDGCCCINNEDISIHDPNGNAVWYLSSIVDRHYENDLFEEYFAKCKIYSGYIEPSDTICISTDGIESFMTKYGSHNEEFPKKVFFHTKELPEKYHNWKMERLYNVLSKGLLPDMNKEGISNIDDLTIIKIKTFKENENKDINKSSDIQTENC